MLPPWLQISPRDYLAAVEAGTRAGLSIRQANQQAWENAQRMQFQADQAQRTDLANRLAQERLDQYRQQELANARSRIAGTEAGAAERARHNLAQESAAQAKAEAAANKHSAEPFEDPNFPGYKFIKQPSGTLTPVIRPTHDLTPAERLNFEIRLRSMMKRSAGERPTDPAYQSRTNFATSELNKLGQSTPTPVKPFKILKIRKRDEVGSIPTTPQNGDTSMQEDETGDK